MTKRLTIGGIVGTLLVGSMLIVDRESETAAQVRVGSRDSQGRPWAERRYIQGDPYDTIRYTDFDGNVTTTTQPVAQEELDQRALMASIREYQSATRPTEAQLHSALKAHLKLRYGDPP